MQSFNYIFFLISFIFISSTIQSNDSLSPSLWDKNENETATVVISDNVDSKPATKNAVEREASKHGLRPFIIITYFADQQFFSAPIPANVFLVLTSMFNEISKGDYNKDFIYLKGEAIRKVSGKDEKSQEKKPEEKPQEKPQEKKPEEKKPEEESEENSNEDQENPEANNNGNGSGNGNENGDDEGNQQKPEPAKATLNDNKKSRKTSGFKSNLKGR